MNTYNTLTSNEKAVVEVAISKISDSGLSKFDYLQVLAYINGQCEGFSYGFIQEYFGCELNLKGAMLKAHTSLNKKLYSDCIND